MNAIVTKDSLLAVITIDSVHAVLPLKEAITVATLIKESAKVDRIYTNTRYAKSNSNFVVELELVTVGEVNQWLS